MNRNYIRFGSFVLKSNSSLNARVKCNSYVTYLCNGLNKRYRFLNSNSLILKRAFSLSQKRNAIPPLLWIFIKPISKVTAILVGRGFRAWFKNIRKHLSVPLFLSHIKRNKYRYLIGTSTVTIGGSVFYYTHLQVAPVTNRKRFILFLPFQIDEIELLSQDAMKEHYGSKIITAHTNDVSRILNILNRIVKANSDIEPIKNTDWKLTLIEDNVVNAAAFPSGHIVVFTGLLRSCKNDDELAAVLGHEISHAILQHTAENLSRSRLIDVLSICMVLTIWTIFPSDLIAGIVHVFSNNMLQFGLELPFSRFLESEADEVGLYLAARACYDVRQFPEFWKRQISSGDIPEVLSTHPSNANRVAELEKLLPQALKVREDCKCQKLPNPEDYNRKSELVAVKKDKK